MEMERGHHNMSEFDYSSIKVIKNPWPEWKWVDGEWQRCWHFEFEHDISPSSMVSDGLSEEELSVHVVAAESPTKLVVTTTTRGLRLSDELFFYATYRLFAKLEERFGKILTIEGQERALWRPYRVR
jgi:hypothetical protein